jgi:PAS domain S-box-containing protein
MKHSHIRETLATFLRKRRSTILRRLRSQIAAAPELQGVSDMARDLTASESFTTLLDLLEQNIADPADQQFIHFLHNGGWQTMPPDIAMPQIRRLIALYRRVITRLIQRSFVGDPSMVHQMIELFDSQCDQLERTLADTDTTDDLLLAEGKYYSLFENASEAIISFHPGEGSISEINIQGERLLGRSRRELVGTPFTELFAAEYRDQAQWLVAQPGGTSNLRLEDMALQRGDGLTIPISLSCNWVEVDSTSIAQVIMRDVTQLRQMQRELQSYAEQLEARVASRTRDLQQSEERYRALFLQEQRRAQHLSLINDVQQCALVTRDTEEFMHQVAAAAQLHFRECDVTFYLCRNQRTTAEASSGLLAAANPNVEVDEPDTTDTGLVTAVASTGSADITLAASSEQASPEQVAPETAATEQALSEQAAPETGADDQAEARTDLSAPATAATRVNDKGPCTELIVAAQVGGYGLAQPVGALHPLNHGLPGHAATHGELLYIANDTLNDPRYFRAPGVHRDSLSQMCVPVSIEGDVIGVISVQSPLKDTFDPRDAVALQTAATIVASHVQSSQILHEMADLQEFNETLIGTMLHSLMVVNRLGIVQLVNERLSQTLGRRRQELINHPVSHVLGEHTMERTGLASVLRDVTETGMPRELPEVHVWTRDAEYLFDLRISRVYFRGEPHVVILLINLTLRWRKTQQLQLMNEMGRFLQASLDINRVLHTVLTCITAGPALGFNRAFLLLFNEDNTILKGAMALGPSSAEEASAIWHEMGRRELSLQDILADETAFDPQHPTPLQERVLKLSINLQTSSAGVLARTVRERRALRVERDDLLAPGSNESLDETTRQAVDQLFIAPELAIAPLVAKSRIVGVVIADNLYSAAPIEDDDVRLLETVAQQAGLTVDNALTYQALQKAQKELVSAERLVAVGEMAARVSHEIRNPLATIGGWAYSILKKPDDSDGVRRKIGIITEEVNRLEELLSDLLDMARPRELLMQAHSINEIVEHALLLAEADIKSSNVDVEKHLGTDIPPGLFDRRRLLQALLNTLRNGAQSMPNGGTLVVSTRFCKIAADKAKRSGNGRDCVEIEIKDSGVGIPERALKQVFDPFFSTKIRGSGLGLAVTLRIIRDHGGTIDVLSEEGKGTTFVMNLPLNTPPVQPDGGRPADASRDGRAEGHADSKKELEHSPAE